MGVFVKKEHLLWNVSGALLLGCFVLCLTTAAFAQTTTASIVGTVTDQDGLSLPKAIVTVTNRGTGAVRTLTTGAAGDYTATLLPIGTYDIQVTAPGFKTSAVNGSVLDVNQTVRVNFRLQVGQATQSVQVTSGVELLKTDQSDVSEVIDSKEITQIPLNGRSFFSLAVLAPGVTRLSRSDSNRTDQQGIVANGASTDANTYTLDGVEMQSELDNSGTFEINPDAIAEFKIMTTDYSAQYGRSAGAQVNVATKSGTNSLHGSAFEFIRNSHLDTRNYFDRPGPLPPFKQNQFGGTVGGPIRKNKIFYFGSYEGYRSYTGLTVLAILPTTAQRGGDLSSGVPIFDPLTTRTDPITGAVIRDSFPNNQIPANRISPAATTALALLYPTPQQQIPLAVNERLNPQQRITRDEVIARLDYQISAKDTLFLRWAGDTLKQFLPTLASTGLPGSETQYNEADANAVISYTRIFSPNTINQAWAGYDRQNIQLFPVLSNSCIVCAIGINGVATDKSSWGPPNIRISGISSVGAFPYAPQAPVSNQYIYNDTLSLVRGKHNLNVGADIDRYQMNGKIAYPSRGTFGFSGQVTSNPQAAAGATGQGIADFLLGYPATTSANLSQDDGDLRALNVGFFVQDDWQVSRDLKLNLGLRYEWSPVPVSARNKISLWDSKNDAVVLAENNWNTPTTAVGFQGQPIQNLIDSFKGIFNFESRAEVGLPRSLATSRSKDFMPRVGFAWRVLGNSKTVLRGGWGLFYETVGMNVDLNETGNPPYGRSLNFTADTNAVPQITLQNPFPSVSVQGKPGFPEGKTLYWRDPYQDNFNVAVQREVFPSSSLDLAYVGGRGVGQVMGTNLNGPVFGLGAVQTRVPDPSHGSVGVWEPWGHRWYDSMQVKWETRLSNLSVSASYTYSKLLTEGGGGINEIGDGARLSWNFFGARPEPTDRLSASDRYLAIDKGRAVGDSPSRLAVAYVWQLPVGKNQRLKPAGPVGWVLGNWQLSGITTVETGDSVTPSLSVDNLNGSGSSRPNVSGNPNHGPKTISDWFNKSAFSAPIDFTTVVAQNLDPLLAAGNSRRGILRGPGYQTWDIGVMRNFPFRDRYNVQFRTEMFNAFNHTNLADPNVSFGTPTFGQITSTAGPSRQIQFGLRITF